MFLSGTKDGCDEENDDFRNESYSTSWTEINVKSLRKVLLGNRCLIFWMITSQRDIKKRIVFRRLSIKIWAYLKNYRSKCAEHEAVPEWEKITVLEQLPCSPNFALTFLLLPIPQKILNETRFEWVEESAKRNDVAMKLPRRILQVVIRSVNEMDEQR